MSRVVCLTSRGPVVRPAFRIRPMAGYEIRQVGRLREWLVVDTDNEQHNMIVDEGTVAGVLLDLATGGLPEGFNCGFRIMWEIDDELPE